MPLGTPVWVSEVPGFASFGRVIQASSIDTDSGTLGFRHDAIEDGWNDAFFLLIFGDFASVHTEGVTSDQQGRKASGGERIGCAARIRSGPSELIGPSTLIGLSRFQKGDGTSDRIVRNFDSKLAHGPQTEHDILGLRNVAGIDVRARNGISKPTVWFLAP